MADIKEKFATSSSITLTINGLTQDSARESTAIDNTSNLYDDVLLYLAINVANSAMGSDKAIFVYLYASEDGTNYTDNATGTDAALTMRSPTNLILLDRIETPTQNIVYKKVWAIAQAFGGVIPRKWGVVIHNRTNQTFQSSSNVCSYTGVHYQTV